MTSEHQGHVCLCLLKLAFQAGATVPSLLFYLGFVGQNSSPHTFKASPLLQDPSPKTPPPPLFLQVYHIVLQSFSFPNTKGSDLYQSFYNSEERRNRAHWILWPKVMRPHRNKAELPNSMNIYFTFESLLLFPMPFLLCVACDLLSHGDSLAFSDIGGSDNHITQTQTAGCSGPCSLEPVFSTQWLPVSLSGKSSCREVR